MTDLALLSDEDRMALAKATARAWGVYAPRGEWDLSTVRNKVEIEVERILAAHLAPVVDLLTRWESGADQWGTCHHEWVSLRELRATLFPPAQQGDQT